MSTRFWQKNQVWQGPITRLHWGAAKVWWLQCHIGFSWHIFQLCSLYPFKHPFTAQQVDQVMLDSMVKLHGIPKFMVTDRDKVFTSLFWKELFILWNTTLLTSTTYHPQTDDQIERVNQCLEMFLRCSVHSTPRRWKSWLPLAEFWYNTSYHSSLGCTPFKALYGYEANVVSAPMIPTTEQRSVQQMFTDR
jgi:hypothetical protein